MAREGIERRFAAILDADVGGHSRLMGEDETGTLVRLKAHRAEFVDPTERLTKGAACMAAVTM